MRKLLSFSTAEQVFTVISLLFYTGGILRLVLSGGANEGDQAQYDSSLIQLTFFLNYLLTGGLVILRWKKVLAFLSRDRWILLMLALVFASYFWSDFPAITLRRSIALFGTSLFGIYFASRYSLKQQLQLLGWTFGLAILLSLIFIVALPQYGISGGNHSGAWRGIYAHKNGFGKKMALSTLVFLLLAMRTSSYRWLLLTGMGTSFAMVLMARSTTALATVVICLGAFSLYRSFRWRPSVLIFSTLLFLIISFIGGLWLIENLETVLTSVGEDITLTGRTGIWPLVIDKIQDRPWLGYGYEGFWRGLDGASAYIYLAGSNPSHAHNEILQLWLNLGFVGVAVLVIGFWSTLLRAVAWIRVSETAEGFWPLLYLTYVLLGNIAESSLVQYNDIEWVLYVAIALSLLHLPQIEPSGDETSPYAVNARSVRYSGS